MVDPLGTSTSGSIKLLSCDASLLPTALAYDKIGEGHCTDSNSKRFNVVHFVVGLNGFSPANAKTACEDMCTKLDGGRTTIACRGVSVSSTACFLQLENKATNIADAPVEIEHYYSKAGAWLYADAVGGVGVVAGANAHPGLTCYAKATASYTKVGDGNCRGANGETLNVIEFTYGENGFGSNMQACKDLCNKLDGLSTSITCRGVASFGWGDPRPIGCNLMVDDSPTNLEKGPLELGAAWSQKSSFSLNNRNVRGQGIVGGADGNNYFTCFAKSHGAPERITFDMSDRVSERASRIMAHGGTVAIERYTENDDARPQEITEREDERHYMWYDTRHQCSDLGYSLLTEDDCIAVANSKGVPMHIRDNDVWTPIGCSHQVGYDVYFTKHTKAFSSSGYPLPCGHLGFTCYCEAA